MPSPSVIAELQQHQAKCAQDIGNLGTAISQVNSFIQTLGPIIPQLQHMAQQNVAMRSPVDPVTPPKQKSPPLPAGQTTLAESIERTRAASVATHRGPGAVRRSPSRKVDVPRDRAARSRSPMEESASYREPSRPSHAVINPAEEIAAAKAAGFHPGVAPPAGEAAAPAAPSSPAPAAPEI